MATRYWVGGAGTWDASDTSHWSASSGGAGGASVPVDGDAVIFDASSGGGLVQLGYDPTVTSISMGAFTGTFDANDFNPTMDTFNCSGSGTRTLLMGSGIWTIRGNNGSVWSTGSTTNLTMDAETSTVRFTYSGSTGTRTVAAGSGGNVFYNVEVTAGSDSYNNSSGITYNILDFTGFTGTYISNTSINILESLVLGAGMVSPSGANSIIFTGTSTTQTIYTNGVQLNRPVIVSGTGNILTLMDDLDMSGAADRTFTVNIGTLDLNDFDLTVAVFSSSGSGSRSIMLGSGTITLTGSATTVWNLNTTTNLTFDAGTSKIVLDRDTATTQIFAGGGLEYNHLVIAAGAGSPTIQFTKSNTFKIFESTGTAAHTIQFTAGTTTTVHQWKVKGSSGNVITIGSITAAAHELVFAGGDVVSSDYLSISYSEASPASTWFAGPNSTDAGNNTGWVFTAPTLTRIGFLPLLSNNVVSPGAE